MASRPGRVTGKAARRNKWYSKRRNQWIAGGVVLAVLGVGDLLLLTLPVFGFALFPLTVAVHKMTALPARKFGLTDRGVVRAGHAADLVLFDAETVRDVATFTDPQRPAEGIHAVWVNGVLSSRRQVPTGARGGRFLSRGTIDPADYLGAFGTATTQTGPA